MQNPKRMVDEELDEAKVSTEDVNDDENIYFPQKQSVREIQHVGDAFISILRKKETRLGLRTLEVIVKSYWMGNYKTCVKIQP